jgi:protocatechuate 3,4-dioxygenase beta subunit
MHTAITDRTGQYRITGLNPCVYSLTLTLAGFNTLLVGDW